MVYLLNNTLFDWFNEDLVRLVLGGVRFAKRTPLKTSRTKPPTHNELRTRRPMW